MHCISEPRSFICCMRLNECALSAHVTSTFPQAILAAYPACALLRRHPTPPPRQFEPLLAAASAAGFSLDVSTSRV